VCAQKSPVFIHSNKAIRGYDPVAYFTEENLSREMTISHTNGTMPAGIFRPNKTWTFSKPTRKNMLRNTADIVHLACPMVTKHQRMPMPGQLTMGNCT
jgi:hypothetical protein